MCDDEAPIRLVVSQKLAAAGYRVSLARTGREGYDLVVGPAGLRPDLVLTDFQMPVMSGLELCKALRSLEATANTPVLMLTARGYTIDPADLAKTNIREVIAKPFGLKQLLERVQAVLASTASDRREAA